MDTSVSAKNRQAALLITQDLTAVPFSQHVIFRDFAQDCLVIGRTAVTAVLHAFFYAAFNHPTITLNSTKSEEDQVQLALTLSGQQIAPFWGLPCTGRTITLDLAIGCCFFGEQITHVDLHYDAGTLLRQLGLAL